MFYNFDIEDQKFAVAALLVYCVYRSRDVKRFKITPDMWGQIERATKGAAKRAEDLGDFLEKIKPKLHCATIQPRWAKTIPDGFKTLQKQDDGSYIEVADLGRRQFLTDVIQAIDHRAVLEILYHKTSLIILLVRDRLEREKPLESSTELEVSEYAE